MFLICLDKFLRNLNPIDSLSVCLIEIFLRLRESRNNVSCRFPTKKVLILLGVRLARADSIITYFCSNGGIDALFCFIQKVCFCYKD